MHRHSYWNITERLNKYPGDPIRYLLGLLATGTLDDGTKVYIPEYLSEWQVSATSGPAADVTATRPAGGPNTRYYITGFHVGYNAAQIGTATLKANGVAVATFDVHNFRDVVFSCPLMVGTDDSSVGLTLSAGASGVVGVVGRVSIEGFTL